jgi:hypothetical protein
MPYLDVAVFSDADRDILESLQNPTLLQVVTERASSIG